MEVETKPFNSLHSQITILTYKLKMLQEEDIPSLPMPSQNLLPTMKDIIETSPDNLESSILPPLLSWIEGKTSSQE